MAYNAAKEALTLNKAGKYDSALTKIQDTIYDINNPTEFAPYTPLVEKVLNTLDYLGTRIEERKDAMENLEDILNKHIFGVHRDNVIT